MIKVFTTNKDGKIELTKDELKSLLDEAYWEGYRANNHNYIYTTPTWKPFTISTMGDNSTISLSAEAIKEGSFVADSATINCGAEVQGGELHG